MSFPRAFLFLIFIATGCSYISPPQDYRVELANEERTVFRKPELPPGFKLEPTFESIKIGILEQKCLFCHQAGKKVARIPLLTREDLLDSPLDIVIPGQSDESGLILVLDPKARKLMPPRRSGLDKVTDEEIAILREWIDRGARD